MRMNKAARFARIVAEGNPPRGRTGNIVKCVDGFQMSVLAHWGAYCSPRPATPSPIGDIGSPGDGMCDVTSDFPGPYTHVEVGFPSARPEPWSDWQQFCEDTDSPTETAYGYVPVEIVAALIEAHGGQAD